MVINIYWNDLSKDGQETLINGGFEPSEEHKSETTPVGVINTND